MTVLNPTNNLIKYFGQVPYPDSMALQDKSVEQVRQKIASESHSSARSDFACSVLGFEYDRVLTLGKRLDPQRVDLDALHQRFSIFSSDRGGLITLHNRGQLVIYPNLPLKQLGIGIRDYLRILCNTTAEFIHEHFQLNSMWNQDAPEGVFVEGYKVAFIGVRIENGVSKHGISLNIRNDVSEFSLFAPCGQRSLRIGNLSDLSQVSQSHELSHYFQHWCDLFQQKLKQSP